MKYVIVEDEIRIREGIRGLLSRLSEDTIILGEAENGSDALEIIRQTRPDIVITDIRMPVMDGLEMLETLYREGIEVKAIVLSAYSEFEYARSAMRLGVTEYLLKPIAINDFMRAIDNVRQQIQKERETQSGQMGSLKQIIKGIVESDIQPDDGLTGFLEKKYGIGADTPIALLLYYMPAFSESLIRKATGELEQILAGGRELSFCIWTDHVKKVLGLALYHYLDAKNLKHWLQSGLLQKKEQIQGRAIGWCVADDLYHLKEQYECILEYLDWNITLGDNIMISYPEITAVHTAVCVYPMELENRMKIAVCKNSEKPLQDCIRLFQQYFRGEQLYEPQKIKECYIRFFWALIHYAKEMQVLDGQRIKEQVLLEKIMNARTMYELEKVSEEIERQIGYKENGIDNMVIKRAVSMIHEYYQNGITLEEIAQRLEITPEYLGTLFYKEMGQNFSTYIKDYRIGKAKEMLIGTNKKIYEIAEKTGYSDPKYFSRVFRETTGQLPKEYRMTHK